MKQAWFLAAIAVAACGDDGGDDLEARCADRDEMLGVTRPAGWTAASHCTLAPPDLETVFPADRIVALTITMTADEYAAMQQDLRELGGGGPPFVDGGGRAAFAAARAAAGPFGGPDPCAGRDDGAACNQNGNAGTCQRTTGPRICQVDAYDFGDVNDVDPEAAAPFWSREPAYFHADLAFDGVPFTSVGIRYKGNFGLASAEGEKKPFRLKLDKWETTIPAITDQRLFGFQTLSFSPNQTDPSNLHQVLANALFREHGIAAPQAGFVEVSLDTGSGPRLLGVYAMTEIPDNPMLEREFDDDTGNLYKPDGRGAHFVSFVDASFHKQNNDTAPKTDVADFVTALHAPRTDRVAWRAGLEARFDMRGFADAYAINQAIGNWDTYGGLAHNFYLYNDPATAQLRYIPWDFDLAFDRTGASDLTLRGFDGRWPLLQALARDVEYATRYEAKLAAFAAAELDGGVLTARVDVLAAMIRPAIVREEAVRPGVLDAFELGIAEMKAHLDLQRDEIRNFLQR